jgi:hypothetical protein
MIKVHLDPTPAIGRLSFNSIGVLADQKAGEAGDGLFIGEKRVFGRSPARKFHRLAIVSNVYIEIEFIETDFGLDLAVHETQAGGGLEKLIQGSRRSHDHVPARSPNASLSLHEFKNFLQAIDAGSQFQELAFGNSDPKKQVQNHNENRGDS